MISLTIINYVLQSKVIKIKRVIYVSFCLYFKLTYIRVDMHRTYFYSVCCKVFVTFASKNVTILPETTLRLYLCQNTFCFCMAKTTTEIIQHR